MKDVTIDNQQEILKLNELGWLAGILEGEGSISLNVRRKKWKGWEGIGVDMNISIGNTDAAIIKECDRIFRKMGASPHICETRKNSITSTLKNGEVKKYLNPEKTMLQLQISKMGAIKMVLEFIEPFMIGDKKIRAQLMMEFIARRLIRKGGHTKKGASWYDGYDWNLVRQFYEITGGKLLPEVREILNDQYAKQAGVSA